MSLVNHKKRLFACIATGGERAAVATILLRGDGANQLIADHFSPATPREIRFGDVRFGTWNEVARPSCENAAASESVVVAMAWSAATTGATIGYEESWEINCHGGEVAAARILRDLTQGGATSIDQSAWTVEWTDDACVCEGIEVLQSAKTIRTAAIALDQSRGAMRRFALESLRMLDEPCSNAVEKIVAKVTSIAAWNDLGRHLHRSWNVVLAGRPNTGKSTLINAILGYRRSITLDLPGTTRDVLWAETAIDGWPIRITDTAGIREHPSGEIERQGIELARTALDVADLIIWVSDASAAEDEKSQPVVTQLGRTIRVWNKIDIAGRQPVGPEEFGISALTGEGLNLLQTAIVRRLVPYVPEQGQPIAVNARQAEALLNISRAKDSPDLRVSLLRLIGNDADLLAKPLTGPIGF